MKNILTTITAGLIVSVLTFGVAGSAEANCGQFPKISLWTELSHNFVRQHVNKKYAGNWNSYLETLIGYQQKLIDIRKRGRVATVTWQKRRVKLQGNQITTFLKFVDQRLNVTRCLADAEVTSLDSFTTAAGGAISNELKNENTEEPKQCDPTPSVSWWGTRNNKSITRYVSMRHEGDWQSYIAKWSERLERLKDIKARGKIAITRTGLKLAGSELSSYIQKMEKRVSVTKCLAGIDGNSLKKTANLT